MLVDVHNHVMPTESLDTLSSDPIYQVQVVDGKWQGAHHVPFDVTPSFYDPAARLEELDARGIDGAIVSSPPMMFYYDVPTAAGAALCASANEGMVHFCERAPDRFRWLANVPLQDPGLACEALVEAANAGCVGAGIGTSVAGKRLDEEPFEEFWATAARLSLPVLVHPAFNEAHSALEKYYLQNVIGNPLETTILTERLICAGVLERHRDLRVILLHGGGFIPYQLGRLRHARTVRPELAGSPEDPFDFLPQLYFDTITHDDQALAYLVSRVGSSQVLLGTDLPYDMAMQEPVTTLRRVLGDELTEVIGSENPGRLFGFPKA
jgi:aminocarboxymuconate-semialdehyde decarboxylase